MSLSLMLSLMPSLLYDVADIDAVVVVWCRCRWCCRRRWCHCRYFFPAQPMLLLYPHSVFLSQTKLMLSLTDLLQSTCCHFPTFFPVSRITTQFWKLIWSGSNWNASHKTYQHHPYHHRLHHNHNHQHHHHHLSCVCGRLVTDPTRIVAVRACITPHPGALSKILLELWRKNVIVASCPDQLLS